MGRTPEGEALRRATLRLTSVSATPRLDAEILLAHALGITREELLLKSASLSLSSRRRPKVNGCPSPAFSREEGQGFDRLSQAVEGRFDTLITRRLAHEPVAYITGTRDFWTITLTVAPGVLIPRPDSETLIEAAVAHFGLTGPRRVLDLGTGSGALLLAALDQWPMATGVGVDASDAALAIARTNAAKIAPGRAEISSGGWEGTGEAFDLVLCNPPYVATNEVLPPDVADWEPASALFAGPDGLDDYRIIARVLAPQLAPGGIACLEIGHMQRDAVTALFEHQGFSVACRNDLGNRPRCLIISAF